MDRNSLLGPIFAGGIILVAFGLDGGRLEQMLSPTSFLIVFGGSLGAMMVAYSYQDFKIAMSSLKTWIQTPKFELVQLMESIKDLAHKSRKDSLLSLDQHRLGLPCEPLRRALQMAVDGQDLKQIQASIATQKRVSLQRSYISIKFWDDFGSFTPTLGIVGAVLGLIHAMTLIDQPQLVGPSIALAFTATLYGIGAANLLFIPISKKLRRRAQDENQVYEMVASGIEGIVEGQNPTMIEENLSVFIANRAA